MKYKMVAVAVVLLMTLQVTPSAFAVGAKEAGASLLLPTTGQAMNGQIGNTKTKVMAGVEVASLTTLAILGGVVGGPVIWAGLGPLIANHAWSAADAYKGAQNKINPAYQQQMWQAQQGLDISRQGRFDRDQAAQSEIRQRIYLAGEAAAYGR